jgi:hypothetical protein
VSKTVEKFHEIDERDLGQRQEYSEDGVDLSLIRWMLDLTPTQRLAAAEQFANDVMELRVSLR